MEQLVSIIVPTKNRCSFLLETLASVQGQTYSHWEVIIVDDGSSDATFESITHLSQNDSRFKYFARRTPHSGAPVCRNEGFRVSSGSLIVFLDSDDYLKPFCLEKRVLTMEKNPDLDFAVFRCQLFQNKPGDLDLLLNVDTEENDLDRFLKIDSLWQTSGPIWRREALNRLGPWDENLASLQDWEFHIRALIRRFNYAKVNHVDYFWRILNSSSVSAKVTSVHHLQSHRFLFDKIYHQFLETDLLNKKRKVLLTGLYYWLAQNWANHGEREMSIQCWNSCRNKKLIGMRLYVEGIIFFLLFGYPLIYKVLYKYQLTFWPKDVAYRLSDTFCNTRIDEPQSL